MSTLPREGETFGRYRVLGHLGRGGMGVVLRALQLDLNREVALKVLPTELADQDEFVQRFRREATMLASVDSPHIITVYEHGEIDGSLFIATQLVRDGDLGHLLDRSGPLPLADALGIVAQLASALAQAHEAGVVHRDVKPSNVLLRHEEAGWHAYLCDFGIALAGDSGLTNAGVVVGTFSYLAPERCEGAPASAASDIYALGCLLVAAVTGTAPYGGSDFQIAQQHVSGPIPQWDPSFAGAAELNAILTRSMAKDPENRYSTARDMRGDLVAAVRQVEAAGHLPEPQAPTPAQAQAQAQATVLRPYSRPAPATSAPVRSADGSRSRRRRLWLVAAAIVGAVALASLGTLTYAALRPDHVTPATRGQVPGSGVSPVILRRG